MIDVSVVTPSYNRAVLLPRVWQSLKNQKASFEWIVVDDGSSDNSRDVCESFNDSRVNFYKLPENRGANAARNAGVKNATGRYIVFLDSDDELVVDGLSLMIAEMGTAGLEIGAIAFTCVIAETGERVSPLDDGKTLDEFDIVCANGFGIGDRILVYRREVFETNLLPEEVRGCEHVFVYGVAKKWNYLLKNLPLSIVHRQADNLSNSASMVTRSFDIARSFEMVMKNHENVLLKCPTARFGYQKKALYRYLVSGHRDEALRLYNSINLQSHSILQLVNATMILVCGYFNIVRFEQWRIERLNRKLLSPRR